jgi:1,4-dihydroxy-2-naphthoate octaprenyltransferase
MEEGLIRRLLGGKGLAEFAWDFVNRTLPFAFDIRSWRAGLKALRMPSLVIAAASCGLGVVLAYRDGRGDVLNAIAVMITGLALQAGVNLVNDFFEFRMHRVDDKVAWLGFSASDRQFLEVLIFLVGLAFFGLAGFVGLFLAWRSGWGLIVLGIYGFAGGFFYTGEPVNYKRRGLAVVLVFFLMGVPMIAGSYVGVAGPVAGDVLLRVSLQAVPVSILVSAILLGNEIRDYESDTRYGIRTLAVRVGYGRAVGLFCALVAAAYAGSAVLLAAGFFPHLRLLPFAVLSAVPPVLFMRQPAQRRGPLIPLVMLHHLAFGSLFCLSWFA